MAQLELQRKHVSLESQYSQLLHHDIAAVADITPLVTTGSTKQNYSVFLFNVSLCSTSIE